MPEPADDMAQDLALGFDYGKRRMGIAVGNAIVGTAKALQALEHIAGQPDWERLDALVDQWGVGIFVVGLPLDKDGTNQKMTNRARNFSEELWGRYKRPVHLMDERYSTIEASSTFFHIREVVTERRNSDIIQSDYLCRVPSALGYESSSTGGA